MTFLKKLGQILAKGLEVASGLSPLITQFLPNNAGTVQIVSHDLAQVAQIIVEIETIGATLGTAGPDKLKMATPLVAQVILQSALLANHEIANPDLFRQAANEYAQATVDLLNSLKDKIDTVSKT